MSISHQQCFCHLLQSNQITKGMGCTRIAFVENGAGQQYIGGALALLTLMSEYLDLLSEANVRIRSHCPLHCDACCCNFCQMQSCN